VPDAVASALKSNLLTIEAAKNDLTLKKHFTAQALNTVDVGLQSKLEELGYFKPDEIDAFTSEKSTYKRISMALDALNAKHKEALKAKHGGDPDAAKVLKDEINTLNSQLLAMKDTHSNEMRVKASEMEKSIMDYAINAELIGKTYANSTLDKSINAMVARQIIEQRLASDGASIVRKDGSLSLVRRDSPELDFMKENKKIGFGDYLDTVLSESKMLQVNDPKKPTGDPLGNRKFTPDNAPKDVIPQAVADDYQRQIDAYAAQV
jgi:hypothetical protein